MKHGISRILLAFLIALSAAACRRGTDSSKFTVETKGGVRYVHSKAPQAESSRATLDLIGKIGELEGREEKDVLYDPVDAVRLPNGDILVLEGKGCDVKRYNSRHEYLSSFGHKGKGPGDFVSPYRMRLTPDKKRLCVADDKIIWLSTEGDYQSAFRPEFNSFSSFHREIREAAMAVLSGGRVILPTSPSRWMDSGEDVLLTIYEESGKPLPPFGAVQHYDNEMLSLNANVACVATDDRDRIYVAYVYQNRIDEFSPDGRMVFSADRALPYPVKTETRMREWRSGDAKIELPTPVVTSVTKGVAVDGRGRIWVLTFLKKPDEYGRFGEGTKPSSCYAFDVFDGDGVWLSRVSFPDTWVTSFSICDDRLFVIDAQDESCVREYRIVENH